MSDGRIMLAIATLIALGVFFNGLRFSRISEEAISKTSWFGRFQLSSSAVPIEHVRRIGTFQMIGAPVFWLFFAAILFGLFGPVDGIQIIKF